jgi:Na+-transporting NADH:ubiquinone oxidoreductase subunit C
MSEPKPKRTKEQENRYTIYFMIVLSFICALILSVLASVLQEPQQRAKEIDRSRQMLIASRIINHLEFFQIESETGEYSPAKFSKGGLLVPTKEEIPATSSEILDVYLYRIETLLVNDKGESTTFEKANIDENKYINDFKKTGYYKEPLKLIYKIYSNSSQDKERVVAGYVIPVNGMGLWNALYGYIALKPDGNKVIGISWYEQGETPGLGGNIVEPYWTSQFYGKHIFQESSSGKTNYALDPIGITVVKGKVADVLGNSPKALSAVDGMAGATLTGNGVTDAYKDSLTPYRPFFIRLNESKEKSKGESK